MPEFQPQQDKSSHQNASDSKTDTSFTGYHETPRKPGDIAEGAAHLPVMPGYEILDIVGRGGMGVVYRACQISLGRVVALKMISSGIHAAPDEMARFQGEAEAIGRLQHPNIVQVYDKGMAEGCPYLVMEFIEGSSLDKRLDGQPQSPTQTAHLVEQLARAVQIAHNKGILHRDLKPSNVLIANDGLPKLVDFGLAKFLEGQGPMTTPGAIVGTPSYMSPEQAGGVTHHLTPACDIYALGVILYECLTGRPPFQGPSPMDTLLQVLSSDAVSPSRLQPKIPRDLETICLKCLHKEPGQRYASAEALADDLRRFQAQEPILARPTSSRERIWKWVRRRPLVAGLVGLLAVVIVVALVAVSTFWLQAERNFRRADDNFRLALRTTDSIRQRVRQLKDNFGTNTLVHTSLLALMDENLKLLRDVEDSPAVRALRADTLQLKADLFLTLGRTDRALPAVNEAIGLYDSLLSNEEKQLVWLAERGRAYFLQGRILAHRHNSTEALKSLRKARKTTDGLLAREPEHPNWWEMKASVVSWIGGRLLDQGYTREADEALAESFAIRKRLVTQAEKKITQLRTKLQAQPTSSELRQRLAQEQRQLTRLQRQFAKILGKRASRLYYRDKITKSTEVYRQQLHLQRQLANQQPSSLQNQRDLAQTCVDLGTVLHEQGYMKEARSLLQEAVRVADALHHLDPSNGELARLHLYARVYRSQALAPGAEPTQAIQEQLEALKEFLPICRLYAEKDSANAQWQQRLAFTQLWIASNTAALIRAEKLPKESLTPWLAPARNAVAIRERLSKADPENLGQTRGVGVAHRWMAEIERVAGFPKKAVDHTQAAEQVLVDFYARRHRREPKQLRWVKKLARAHVNLAITLLTLDQKDKAGAEYKKSVTLVEHISGDDTWKRELANMHAQCANYHPTTSATYLTHHQKALVLREKLAAGDQTNISLQKELLQSYQDMALGFKHQNQPKRAMQLYEKVRSGRLTLAAKALRALIQPPPSKGKSVSAAALAVFYKPAQEKLSKKVIATTRKLFEKNRNSDTALELVETYLRDIAKKDIKRLDDRKVMINRLKQVLQVYDDLRKARPGVGLLVEELQVVAAAVEVLETMESMVTR